MGRDGANYYNSLGYLPFTPVFTANPAFMKRRQTRWNLPITMISAPQSWRTPSEKNAEAETFARHAVNYTNLFDAKIGFIRERKADGSWNEPFCPEQWGGGFTEGCSWHWTWCVFHDILPA